MSSKKKLVINSREIAGVAAKLNKGVNRPQDGTTGHGLYTLRLKVTSEAGFTLLGILSAFARSRKQAIKFVEARMKEMRLSAHDFALLRYTPSECSETMEKIIGVRQFFKSSKNVRAFDWFEEAA